MFCSVFCSVGVRVRVVFVFVFGRCFVRCFVRRPYFLNVCSFCSKQWLCFGSSSSLLYVCKAGFSIFEGKSVLRLPLGPRSRASYLQAMAKDELWEELHHMVRKHFTRNQFDVLPERSGQGSQACAIFVATVIAMFWDGRLPEFPLVFDETFWLGVLAKAVEGGDQFGHIRGSNVFEAVTMACWAVAN